MAKMGRPVKDDDTKKSVTVKVRMSPRMYESVIAVTGSPRKVAGLIRRLLRSHLGAEKARERRKNPEEI